MFKRTIKINDKKYVFKNAQEVKRFWQEYVQ